MWQPTDDNSVISSLRSSKTKELFIQHPEVQVVKISDESSWLVRILPLIHSMVQTQEVILLNFRSFLLISVNLNKDYSFDAVPGNLSKIL